MIGSSFRREMSGEQAHVKLLVKGGLVIAGLAVCYKVLSKYAFTIAIPCRAVGISMLPTLQGAGEAIIVDVFSHKVLGKPFEVGDIVLALHPVVPGMSKSANLHASALQHI